MAGPQAAATAVDPKAPAKADAQKEEKKEKKVRRSSFEDLYPKDSKLVCLVKENPKKKGSKSAERFEHYFTSKTVGAFLTAGGTYGDIAFDIARKRIAIG